MKNLKKLGWALTDTANNHHLPIVKYLLDANSDKITKTDSSCLVNALLWSIIEEKFEVVSYLLRHDISKQLEAKNLKFLLGTTFDNEKIQSLLRQRLEAKNKAAEQRK